MGEILLIFVVAAILFAIFTIVPAVILRWLARIPFYWTFTPENTFSIPVADEDDSGDGSKGGGSVRGFLHGISGRVLDRNDTTDVMEWELQKGDEPGHNTLLFRNLGIQSLGNIFWSLRLNTDERLRFTREKTGKVKTGSEGDESRETTDGEMHVVDKSNKTKHVFFSGELTVVIKEADTLDGLGIHFEIDFVFERQFPVKSVLRLANSAAFLTSMVERIVNEHTVNLPAEAYVGGIDIEAGAENRYNIQEERQRLAAAIESNADFSAKVLEEIGLNITAANIREVTMEENERKLLKQRVEARKAAEAKVITAKGDRDAQKALNEGVAHRLETVIKPSAETPEIALNFRTDREASAYENNETLTTLVKDSSKAGVMIPAGD